MDLTINLAINVNKVLFNSIITGNLDHQNQHAFSITSHSPLYVYGPLSTKLITDKN